MCDVRRVFVCVFIYVCVHIPYPPFRGVVCVYHIVFYLYPLSLTSFIPVLLYITSCTFFLFTCIILSAVLFAHYIVCIARRLEKAGLLDLLRGVLPLPVYPAFKDIQDTSKPDVAFPW